MVMKNPSSSQPTRPSVSLVVQECTIKLTFNLLLQESKLQLGFLQFYLFILMKKKNNWAKLELGYTFLHDWAQSQSLLLE